MIVGIISDTDKLAAPLAIDHPGFEALTDAQRKQYGFWPCELRVNDDCSPGEQVVHNGISRRVDRLRAHHKPSGVTELKERHHSIETELAAYKSVLMQRLSEMPAEDALSSMAVANEVLCDAIHELLFPPTPDPDEEVY